MKHYCICIVLLFMIYFLSCIYDVYDAFQNSELKIKKKNLNKNCFKSRNSTFTDVTQDPSGGQYEVYLLKLA